MNTATAASATTPAVMLAVQISTLRRRRRGRGGLSGGSSSGDGFPGGSSAGAASAGPAASSRGAGSAGGDVPASPVGGSADAIPWPASSGGIELPICHSTRVSEASEDHHSQARNKHSYEKRRPDEVVSCREFRTLYIFCLAGSMVRTAGPPGMAANPQAGRLLGCFEGPAGLGGGAVAAEQPEGAVVAVSRQREPGVPLHVGQRVQHGGGIGHELGLLGRGRERVVAEVGQPELGQPDRLVVPVVNGLDVALQLAGGVGGVEVAAVPVQGDEVDPVAAGRGPAHELVH